jgi:molybdopterin synthase catalytic subunit
VISPHPFDPWAAIQQHAASLNPAHIGALASFVGTMRDFNEPPPPPPERSRRERSQRERNQEERSRRERSQRERNQEERSRRDSVTGMFLEHYPGMTETYLEKLQAEARQRWAILDSLIVHRVGELRPGDPIVLVAVWAAHRAPAFDACRYLIEELKHRAPFWKRETLADGGSRWVEWNTPGTV